MKKILITGGAGFIGINSAKYFLDKGWMVFVLDNFSRAGSEKNIAWLKKDQASKNLKIIRADIRYDLKILEKLISQVGTVLHLAAQTAVTTSFKNPREDFEINALGTFNILEVIRESKNKPIIVFSSTNKVYGGMEDVGVKKIGDRYQYQDLPYGVAEDRILDFHSPYGCSNGTADQYVRDYARMYGLRTVVFRQSCIYGPHQFGIEDQGWVAWFIIATLLGKPLTIYGDGKQTRDVLFVDDLNDAYWLVIKNIKETSGQIYNIGGGYKNQLSLLELIGLLEGFLKRKIEYKFDQWRPGDQPIFVADIRKAKKDFNWQPKVSVNQGVKKIFKWVNENKGLFR
jgi:CDP-paratose 2-epimerase|tara:strand:+ start:19080 stop:20105 length:1026 start_codon:yes stop_codon:yes gene_type:complete